MYSGLGVSKGVASGKLCFCKDSFDTYEKQYIQDVAREKENVKRAFESTAEELTNLYELAKERVGLTVAAIVDGHRSMIEDKGCFNQITTLIEKRCVNAEWAIQEIFQGYILMMRKAEDTYLKARAADFEDLLHRVECELANIKGLQKAEKEQNQAKESFLAIGRQFDVEDILSLYEQGAVGIIDLSGAEESHALVVAKSLDLPMVIQVAEECLNLVGQYCSMDGTSGNVKAE
ncbi:MAG: phosphoenolpyruvate-utilizing N-terminal domain-containing protein [Clostridiales bacterium]|nr:phosphoenolpyruvate-utilizing N-terminal domain-containing protein [Clostridiales bacterium]